MPDTTGYLLLGLSVVFGVLGFYIFTLALRLRSARQEVVLVQQIIDDEE